MPRKIRKILLISPIYYDKPGLISGFLRFLPLNLAYLMALAPEYKYDVVDENFKKLDFDSDLKDVDIVGITAMTVQAPRAYALGDELRRRGITVVMGGSHPTALPQEALQHADAVVIGEAEGLWRQLLKDFENGKLASVYKNEKFPSLVHLPFPKRDVPLKKYNYFFPNTLQVGRGCPFNCAFCSVTRFFGYIYRFRPIPDVVEEIKKMMAASKKKVFAFLDDNIFGRPSYAKELFRALIPLKILWGSQASVNMAQDEEAVRLAAKSGCKFLFVGLESINESSLKEVGKRQNNPLLYQKAIKLFHKYGIAILGAFIFGFDSDTKSLFRQTIRFAQRVGLDFIQATVLTPLPGTRLTEALEKEGRITDYNWRDYDFGHVVFKTKNISADDLIRGFRSMWREFYSLKSIFLRLPLWQREWWSLLWHRPKAAWLRLVVFVFGNIGFHFQVRKRMKNAGLKMSEHSF